MASSFIFLFFEAKWWARPDNIKMLIYILSFGYLWFYLFIYLFAQLQIMHIFKPVYETYLMIIWLFFRTNDNSNYLKITKYK